MQKFKAIIIDDEEHCIKTLAWNLQEYCKEIEVVATATNGTEGIKVINEHKPDIVFLDVEMPMMTGIEMLKHFEDIKFKFVFTTAYDQYAVKAIKLNALDYLLKPVDKDELVLAVEKLTAQKELASKEQISQLQEVHRSKVLDKIALSTNGGLQFVKLDDVVQVTAEGSYCKFILTNKKTILLSKTVGSVEEILKDHPDFFRAHKSYLVNLKHIDRYIRGDGGEIVMQDGTMISLSRNKKDEFLQLFEKV